MGVRYEARSADGREFRRFKYVFYGKARVEAAMRTSEKHEMNEKVSVSGTVLHRLATFSKIDKSRHSVPEILSFPFGPILKIIHQPALVPSK